MNEISRQYLILNWAHRFFPHLPLKYGCLCVEALLQAHKPTEARA